MIKDIKPTVGVWQNVYALTGFTVGTPLLMQNKNGGRCAVWEGAAPPTSDGEDDRHGYELVLGGLPARTLSANPPGVWVLYWEVGFTPKGRMCVQEWAS
ncbi:hypothetical protein G169_gp23 [Pseudomonas phage AF]|uniref:hypothetical protein n=1 Tax=Pseudomonas phage AF TaxID=1235689 RepID=UPI00029716B1|nr:hypothetical protein G169_gp23 [Pseudomonas phage AF]AFV50638.1 hypothetical protein AF_023 [Pseudomonas phage AF]